MSDLQKKLAGEAAALRVEAGMIVGPAIGGYLYAILPPLPYIVAGALFAVSITALSFIGKVPQPPIPGAARPIGQMIDGLHYVVRNIEARHKVEGVSPAALADWEREKVRHIRRVLSVVTA